MFYCNELPFGLMSPNHFLNIETMNFISSFNDDYYDDIDDADYDRDIHDLKVEIINSKIIRKYICCLII